jgi:hypothetical protein
MSHMPHMPFSANTLIPLGNRLRLSQEV